jgi:hypothetical protein
VAREVLSAQGWPGRTLAGANDAAAACWPSTLTAIRSGGEHSWMPARRGRSAAACPAHLAYLEAGSPASLRRP